MRIKILRLTQDKNKVQKLGRLMVFDGWHCLFWCHILEPFEGIKAGSYTVKKYNSPKFGAVLLYNILDKDGKQRYFEIHYGNYRKDTKGCQLTGEQIADINSDGLYDVTNSKETLEKLLKYIPDNEEVKVDVFENPSEF